MKKKVGGGVDSGRGDRGGIGGRGEPKNEVIVKMKKKSREGVLSGVVEVNQELKLLCKCKKGTRSWGGGWGGWVDVNKEL